MTMMMTVMINIAHKSSTGNQFVIVQHISHLRDIIHIAL